MQVRSPESNVRLQGTGQTLARYWPGTGRTSATATRNFRSLMRGMLLEQTDPCKITGKSRKYWADYEAQNHHVAPEF